MHSVYVTYSGHNCEAVLQVMETLVRSGYALMCECMLPYGGDPEAQAQHFICDADAVVAVITEDASIERAMKENGVDVLRVAPGYVALDGYDRGFIGGASGADNENVYFCGDLSTHPNSNEIKEFCRQHGKNCVSLGSGRLYDVGTIFFLE